MIPAILALPNGLFFRINKPVLWSSFASHLKSFSTSLTVGDEETPAMKALKEIPYPSASPDTSLFESWSDEYIRVSVPHSAQNQKPQRKDLSSRNRHNASDLLEQLSRDGEFAEAEVVRKELVGMNVHIRPSFTYYAAAWNVLRQHPWPPNRAEMFANWLSLLPTKAEGKDQTHNFNDLKSSFLFNSSKPDLESVAHFGVILSSKGYISHVGMPVVVCLTRFAHPDVSSRILNEMTAADYSYMQNNHHLSQVAKGRYKNNSKWLWSLAVRTHCNTRRPQIAFQVAKRAHEHGFRLSYYTYQYLLGKLEADGLNESAAELRTLSGHQSLDVAKSRFPDKDPSTSNSIPPISFRLDAAVNRTLALATLERSSQFGEMPSASDIVPYFDIHKTGLRGGPAMNELRSSAYNLSLPAASTVLLAEMLHHHRRGEFKHLLWVFEKFFHLVGVAVEDVKRRLWTREYHPPEIRLNQRFNLPRKIWPTTHHTSLVWTALVQLCEDEQEFLALYDQLLELSAARSQRLDAEQNRHHYQDQDQELDKRRRRQQQHDGHRSPVFDTSAERYDAAHFRPFLVGFTLLSGPKQGLKVLDDMQARGIAPSAHFLSTAAALQARHGEAEMALRLLDVIKELNRASSLGSDSGLDVEPEMARTAHDAGGKKEQALLLAAYTAVLRGFLDRRALNNARRVAELIRVRLKYDGGTARTDNSLRFLRRLELEGLDAKPDVVYDLADNNTNHHPQFYPFLRMPDAEVGLFFILRSRRVSN
jgi:hypothetical protein